MGFFSWKCRHCDESILSHWALEVGDSRAWMTQAVAVRKDGSTIDGEYDGYGNLAGVDLMAGWREDDIERDGILWAPENCHMPPNPEIYHTSCYAALGRLSPAGPSKHAEDQGYFIDEDDGKSRPPPPCVGPRFKD